MAQETMYSGLVNSPETTITNNINTSDTLIYVLDPARVPSDLPNLMTIGTGTNAETVLVESINDSAITVQRGFQGIAKEWPAGTIIARNFTEYDHAAFKSNIEDLDTRVGPLANLLTTIKTSVVNAINSLKGEFDAHSADYASKFPNNAGAHNSIYRGKYLGSSVTAEQYTAISSGTFEDLYIGDYWTIGGVNYRIAAFNYYMQKGDTATTVNHITLVPDTSLYNHVMNDTDITTGGYVGSKMYTTGLEQAKTTIKNAFSGHVLKHRKILSNAVADGKASGWAWFDSEVDLMNEVMVYGSVGWGGSGYNIGEGMSQLPLFTLRPDMISNRQHFWLRDVVSASYFAYVTHDGYATANAASSASGVRPAFSIS